MFAYLGKKLLFMGCEFGQGTEWDFDGQLDWYTLQYPLHQGLQQLSQDLNHQYRALPALHRKDFEVEGFEWVDCHDASQSVLSFIRRDGNDYVIVVLNFTPVARENYRLGVSDFCDYEEVLNSDSEIYGGSNVGNSGRISCESVSWMGRDNSIVLTLPPLGALILRPAR